MSTPPGLALNAFYDGILQAALRQFFRRASLTVEPRQSATSDRAGCEAAQKPGERCDCREHQSQRDHDLQDADDGNIAVGGDRRRGVDGARYG